MTESRKERRRREHKLRKEALRRQRRKAESPRPPKKTAGKHLVRGIAVLGTSLVVVLALLKQPDSEGGTEVLSGARSAEKERFSPITATPRRSPRPGRLEAGTPEFERIMANAELGKHPQIPTLDELLGMSEKELGAIDLAVMNLAVAKTVLGDNYTARLKLLDQWTDHLKAETEKHLHQFHRSPEDFHDSEGYFRVLLMNTILKEDLGIRYNPERMESPDDSNRGFGFFRNPADVFLSGLLADSVDRRTGTCSSLPVLFAALGRRLGYPIKLAVTKGHLFCRWDDGTERFNFEITNRGVSVKSDDHYREWPFPITREEEANYGYLRSLGPKEELAVFLSTLGNVNMAPHRFQQAGNCYRTAGLLAPELKELRTAFVLAKARQMDYEMNRRKPLTPSVTP